MAPTNDSTSSTKDHGVNKKHQKLMAPAQQSRRKQKAPKTKARAGKAKKL